MRGLPTGLFSPTVRVVCRNTDFYLTAAPDICLCLPPDRTLHKDNDLKVDYSLEERKVGHEPRLEPCLTLLVIGPLRA